MRHAITAALGVLLTFIILGIVSEAEAQVRRYALIIGANTGEPGDEQLLYAVQDAERMASVLTKLGGVLAEDMVVLRDPSADEVERVLRKLSSRIEAGNARAGDDESLLYVFYSGHADATAMHLGGTLLHFDKIRAMIKASPAKVRVMIIDACRSGGLTRVKGAKPVAPFKIDAMNRLDGEGMAIIASSAANEDALESERLGGSFFTHHFVTGLLGAADTSGDKRITLTEAYKYAYVETLRATSRSASIQHPTYAFRISGRDDLVLTRLDQRVRGLGRIKIEAPGNYVFFEGGEGGALVAEVRVEAAAELVLAAGDYLVRRRERSAVYEVQTRVAQNGQSTISAADMRRVPYGEVVRKGMSKQASTAWGFQVGASLSDEILPSTGPLVLGVVGTQLDLGSLTFQLRARYGQSRSTNPSLTLQQQVIGGDVAALKLMDIFDLSAGFGIHLGGDFVRQTFETDGEAPDRGAFVGRGGALLHLSWAPASWMTLFVDGALDAYLLRGADGAGGTAFQSRLVPSTTLGLTIYLP